MSSLKHFIHFSILTTSILFSACSSNNETVTTQDANSDTNTPKDTSTEVATDIGIDTSLLVLNGCTDTSFTDKSVGNDDSRTVKFGNTEAFQYNPKCIAIKVGQTVTFSGDFTNHPLHPGVGRNATEGSPNNPIIKTETGTTASFTFSTVGTYPYNCNTHDRAQMNGVVRVMP